MYEARLAADKQAGTLKNRTKDITQTGAEAFRAYQDRLDEVVTKKL